MKIKLIVDGGEMRPGPAVAQQLGPAGINIGKVISDVNSATQGFKGVKVPVELDVNLKSKTYLIKVFSPPVSELIKKELGLESGSGKAGSFYVGNIAMERIIDIAKTKMSGLLAKDLKKAVKLVIGSCLSLGILIDSKPAKEMNQDIDSGKYDKEIKNEQTLVSEEKKKELAEFFVTVKDKQDKAVKAAEEAAKVAEDAKLAAAVAAGTTPVAGAAVPSAVPGAPAPAVAKEIKKEVKKEAKK